MTKNKKSPTDEAHEIELEEFELKREYAIFFPILIIISIIIIFGVTTSPPRLVKDLIPTQSGNGYYLAYSDGTFESHGDAEGIEPDPHENELTIAGDVVETSLWITTDRGVIRPQLDGSYFGGLETLTDQKVVDIIAATDARSYRIVTEKGGVYSFNTTSLSPASVDDLNEVIPEDLEIVAMAKSGNEGYWLISKTGTIYEFGDVVNFGDVTQLLVDDYVVDIDSVDDGSGLIIATSKGQVITLGNTVHYGDKINDNINQPIIGIDLTPSAKGYWLLDQEGNIFAYGDAVTF